MLSERVKAIFKEALIVSSVLATVAVFYYGFAVVERYRAMTKAHIEQSQALLELIYNQNEE